MEFLVQELLTLLKNKKSITVKEIEEKLEIEDEKGLEYLQECLLNLEVKGIIYQDKIGIISLLSNKPSVIQGSVHFNADGNAVITNIENKQVIIPKSKTSGLLERDIIAVTNLYINKNNQLCGTLDKIIKRKKEQISCVVIFENGRNQLVAYNSKNKSHVRINQRELDKKGVGEILLVKLFTSVNNEIDGEYVKKIGHINDPDVDEKAILYDHGFNTEFDSKVLKELEKIPSTVNFEKALKEGRRDLTGKVMVTIDGDDTKDIDDSVGVETLPNGNYKLYVNIADVSYYVKPGSAIDKEAYKRGVSAYPNDKVNPMLPPKLSNGICSLHPHVNRLTKTCEMIINKDGKIVDYEIYDSVINSKKQMTYQAVNKILENGEMVAGYEEFYDNLKTMQELSEILSNIRAKKGFISFSKADIKAIGKGRNITFRAKKQGVSETIIENFMIAANKTIATHFFYLCLPFIFRIHEAPDEDKMKDFLNELEQLGFKFKKCKSITSNSFIQQLCKMLAESNAGNILSELLLMRTMKKARYSNINLRHFGLAEECYTHFTSPIRRYADLQVHRLITLYKKYKEQDYLEINKLLSNIANHCSERSREADKVEKEAYEMRVAEYMENNIGKKFNAIITNVSQNSLKVKTSEGFSGTISLCDLKEDHFKYDGKSNRLIGTQNGVTYIVGQEIEVIVKNASKHGRVVKFITGRAPVNDNGPVTYKKQKKHQ